ncbi:MAG TPA: IclR family transcriptional regulator [Planctomycetota bacterium]|nr:IclR family transcriptional regulator [Planctomycetota bacterium]
MIAGPPSIGGVLPPPSAVPAVDLALEVLEQLSVAPAGTPTEIARARNLSRVGVTRVLQALQRRGYVYRDAAQNRYALTAKLFGLAAKAPGLDIAAVARPHLERLSAQTGETAELAILDGEALLLVDAVDSPQPIRIFARPGSRESLYRMAPGKVLLAELDTAAVTRLFQAGQLTAKPEYLPASLEALNEELAKIRSQGYATDRKRSAFEVERIAATVHSAGGRIAGAIGVAGPVSRMAVTETAIRQVQETAQAISRDLGFSI